MSKRETKANVILTATKIQVDKAKEKVVQAQQEVIAATQVLAAFESVYAILERTLAPAPRTSSNGTSKSPSKRASKAAATAMTEVVQKRTACSQCGEADDHSNHDKAYLSSHSFLQPLTAPSAKKKSSPVNGSKAGGEASLSAHEMSAMNASNAEGN